MPSKNLMLKKKYLLKEISISVYFTDTFLSAKHFESNFIEIFINSDGAHGMPATTKGTHRRVASFFYAYAFAYMSH